MRADAIVAFAVAAINGSAVVDVYLAVCAIPASIAFASVRVDSVFAAAVATINGSAVVDVVLAICSIKSGGAGDTFAVAASTVDDSFDSLGTNGAIILTTWIFQLPYALG